MDHLHELACQAKEAAGKLALYDTATKNRGLEAIALALEARQGEILEANDRPRRSKVGCAPPCWTGCA